MPTIEETLSDVIRRLDENEVVVNAVRSDTDTARQRADQAIFNIQAARVDVRGYTDVRIQEVYDYFTDTLATWAQSILDAAGGYADGVGAGAVGTAVGTWTEQREWIEGQITDILADYERLSDWADDTYSVEIPRIMAEIAAIIEQTAQMQQDIDNEVGLSRQEVAEMASRWREILDNVQETKDKIIEMDYSIYDVKEEINRNIAVEFDGRFASFDERITVAAGEAAGVVADRVEQLEVQIEDQQASVVNLERAMIEGDQELALTIQSLSVGTNTQFDPASIWHFDANNEGWNGTWNDGFIRTGTSVTSPVIAINASQYRQVRMRIRRIGNPTWNGSLNWEGATPAGPLVLAEPFWTGEYGEVTANPAWSGTLTRMTLTLGFAEDAENYFLLDWITVGRPAPGASSADVTTERLARINADGALGLRMDAIELSMTTGDGFITVVSEAIDGLRSELTDNLDGSISAVNESITALGLTVSDLNTGQTVTSQALSALTNRVDTTEEGISAVNSRIDSFTINLDGLAESSVIQDLYQRVDTTDDALSIATGDITSLSNTVGAIPGTVTAAQGLAQNAYNLAGQKGRVFVQNSAPPVAERLAANLWIDTTAGANTPKRWDGSNWTAVTDKVARDAAEAAAEALRVVGSKADGSAVAALTQRVGETEGRLSSVSADVVNLTSSVTVVGTNVGEIRTAAQNAYDLANGRGRVLFQSATPAVEFRSSVNLWIDTTNGINQPKRWNGTAWVPVQDKTALDALAAANAANNALSLKADASAVSALTTRVGQTESGITAVARDITSMTTSIGSAADTAAAAQAAANAANTLAGGRGRVFFQATAPTGADRAAVNLWINTSGNVNTPMRWNGTAWVAVTDRVATQALAAAQEAQRTADTRATTASVTLVDQRVTNEAGRITAVSNRVTTTESRINNPTTGLNALSTSITNVNSRVTNLNGIVASHGSSIQNITASVGTVSASGLIRMYVAATPAGALSRIGIQARASDGDNSQAPGLFIEAGTDGENNVTIMANRFAFINQQNGGTRTVPFFISNGVTFMRTAMIQDLTIGRGKIGDNEITMQFSTNSDTIVINLEYAAKVIIMTAAQIMGTNSTHTTTYEIFRNGTRFEATSFSVSQYTAPYSWFHNLNLPAGRHTFRFQYSDRTDARNPRMAVFAGYK